MLTDDVVNECDFCGDDFPSNESLKDHINTEHPTSSNITEKFDEKVVYKQFVIEERSGEEKAKKREEEKLTDVKHASEVTSKSEMIRSEKTEAYSFDQQKFIAEGLVNNFANAMKDADKNTKVMAIAMLQKTNPDLVSKKAREKINVEDFRRILSETGMSQRKLFSVMGLLRRKWGQAVFEPRITSRLGRGMHRSPDVMPDTRVVTTNPNNPSRKARTGREVRCELCSRELANTFCLRRHVSSCVNYPRTEEERRARREKGAGPKSDEVKSGMTPVGELTCHLCGKNFKQLNLLKSHMHVHSPTKVLVDL